MRRYRAANGKAQLWFAQGEIERIIECELTSSGLMPTVAEPVVDLERFVERHLSVALDHYAELDSDVLGTTEFFRGKGARISINRDLTGSALDNRKPSVGTRGRWRATLAHEAGHVILHRKLFDVGLPPGAGGRRSLRMERHRQQCLKSNVPHSDDVDPREYQANQAMAVLLMPRGVFLEIAREEISRAFPGCDRVPPGSELRLAVRIARRLEVSRQAAAIRMSTLGLSSSPGLRRA